uniref:RING-type E3 ubiquitin transferase n=1 Tax=Graphocephala atropunctata TaxID=36148 RepID=A0A1B6MDI2_9HEMI
MEEETAEVINIESDSSDSSVTDRSDNELNWDSGESRPPGPSPPSSTTMNRNRIPMVLRSQRGVRRRIPSMSSIDTQSDDPSMSVSEVSTSSRPSSRVTTEFGTGSAGNDDLSDSDVSSFSQFSPHSPLYSPSPTVDGDVEDYQPSNRSNSPIPHSPDYSPPSSPTLSINVLPSDVLIVETPHVEVPANTVAEVLPNDQSQTLTALTQPGNNVSVEPDSTKLRAPDSVLDSSTMSNSEEGSLCTICMEPLTNSGSHRVCCLRCGHIFGHSCVERWIKIGCNNGARRCPTCNKKACLKDIRILYLPKVVPLDTVEKDRLISEKEELLLQKNVIEMELSRCKLQSELNTQNYELKLFKLEKDLREAFGSIELLSQGKKVVLPDLVSLKKEKVGTELLHMVDISKEGGCRVLAFNHLLHELIVSQPSGNTIFAGYGIRVLNSVDFQPTRYIYLHHKMIRDLAFHREDRNLLLSASLDNSAKLVDVANSTTVHTFKTDGALWSCCWDATNPHLLLVGSQSGKVYQYDRRMVDTYVQLWEEKSNSTPVVALASAPSVANTPFPQGGFISCRLNAVFGYVRHGDKFSCQELPLEGPFMSMKYDHTTQTLLTTSRPSSRCPYAKTNLNLMEWDAQGQMCLPLIHTFNCGSSARVMSRLTTLPVLGDSLVVAHHESGRTVNMWSSKTGELAHSFPVKEPVIDLTSMDMSNKCLLASLSDKKIGVYKVTT